MERLQQLIGKLNEQFEQKADPTQLLVTTQLIEKELLRLTATSAQAYSTSKIAVVMPGRSPVSGFGFEVSGSSIPAAKTNSAQPETPNTKHETILPFDPLREIPTLAHQATIKELNEVIASEEYSLNDKLKENVKEVAHLLTDAPVRDLRRAIGINDRFVFISELFRGDEVMYERSIKTINGFRIFPEAEYWIERELKIKLAWDETKDCTRHFYQLVKRRFS